MSRRTWIARLGLAAAATGLAANAAGSPPAIRCSLLAFYEFRLSAVRFVGTATGDTALAGLGNQGQAVLERFQRRSARSQLIYGQVFRVHAADSSLSAALSGQVRSGITEAVIVPWGYDAGCRPEVWEGSARWNPVGTRGLYSGALRERSLWVGDRPTFDVTAALQPYPSSSLMLRELQDGFASVGADRASPILTPEELLAFYEVLPPTRLLEAGDSARAAIEPLLRWIRQHPELARRRPAANMILGALDWVAVHRLRSQPSELAGTYRFTLTSTFAESLQIFTRTESIPSSPLSWAETSAESIAGTVYSIPRPTGYSLLSLSATTLDGLPLVLQESNDAVFRQGSLEIEYPPLAGSGTTSWRGGLEIFDAAIALNTNPTLGSTLRLAQQWAGAVERTGTFTRGPDGRVRFDWVLRGGDRTILTIRGERISLQTLAER
jgi:hypothetical protein